VNSIIDAKKALLLNALREGPVSVEHADVTEFHEKMNFAYVGTPRLLPLDLLEFRLAFLREELTEFEDAHVTRDLVKSFDALLDLAYVCIGTAQLMGLPWAEGWRAVQTANMRKERGVTKRGHALDAVKPPGWVGPEATLAALLTKRLLDGLDPY
jgi:predicted HAD superfamily Cof-like phosphohydrolase